MKDSFVLRYTQRTKYQLQARAAGSCVTAFKSLSCKHYSELAFQNFLLKKLLESRTYHDKGLFTHIFKSWNC